MLHRQAGTTATQRSNRPPLSRSMTPVSSAVTSAAASRTASRAASPLPRTGLGGGRIPTCRSATTTANATTYPAKRGREGSLSMNNSSSSTTGITKNGGVGTGTGMTTTSCSSRIVPQPDIAVCEDCANEVRRLTQEIDRYNRVFERGTAALHQGMLLRLPEEEIKQLVRIAVQKED